MIDRIMICEWVSLRMTNRFDLHDCGFEMRRIKACKIMGFVVQELFLNIKYKKVLNTNKSI